MSDPDPTAQATSALLRNVPGPRALAAILRAIGPDAASALTLEHVGAALDGACSRELLGATDEWAENPWLPAVATLTDDPSVLLSLVDLVLPHRTAVGWVTNEALAVLIVNNPHLNTPARYLLANVINPYSRPDHWEAWIENPPTTRAVAQALLDAGVILGQPDRAVRPLMLRPGLDADTAVWVLEQLAAHHEDSGLSITIGDFAKREDLADVLNRGFAGDVVTSSRGLRPRTVDVLERSVARLASLVGSHDAHGWDCRISRDGWSLLANLVREPEFPFTDAMYEDLLPLGHAARVLAQREDLLPHRYAELAALAEADSGRLDPRFLAANPACPDALLVAMPATGKGSDYALTARVAAARFGDDPAAYATLVRLLRAGAVENLSVDACVSLVEQVASPAP